MVIPEHHTSWAKANQRLIDTNKVARGQNYY